MVRGIVAMVATVAVWVATPATPALASRPCGTIPALHAFGSSVAVSHYRTRVRRGHTSCHEARRALRWYAEFKSPHPGAELPPIYTFEGWVCGGKPGVTVGTGPYTCTRRYSPSTGYREEIEALP